jgi:hypothetical protein
MLWMRWSFEVNEMIDQKSISRSTRSFGLAFALMMVLGGGLILVEGPHRSDNPYLPVGWAAILIGSMGSGALFLLERWRKPAKEVK